jgi:hypothetical protein
LAVSTTSKSPKDILLTALSVGEAKLSDYSHRNSPKKFTQPQLFACLVLKTSLGLDYRGLTGLLDDSADLCQLIGLESVPHYTTFQKASRKLLVNSLVQALLDETVTRALGRRKTVKHAAGEEKVSGTNGTVEEYQQSDERAEVLLTRDQFFGILVVVW